MGLLLLIILAEMTRAAGRGTRHKASEHAAEIVSHGLARLALDFGCQVSDRVNAPTVRSTRQLVQTLCTGSYELRLRRSQLG